MTTCIKFLSSMTTKKHRKNLCFLVDVTPRRVELRLPAWKADVLTDRRWGHIIFTNSLHYITESRSQIFFAEKFSDHASDRRPPALRSDIESLLTPLTGMKSRLAPLGVIY